MPVGLEEAFPWEYVHLDDILVDLKLSPTTLEVPVPKYFKEEKMQQQEQRNRLVSGYMRLKHQTGEQSSRDKIIVASAMKYFEESGGGGDCL